MSVRQKGRRKIICNDQRYIWYVDLDDDSPNYLLHIVSEDKRLILTYPLGMNYVIVKGNYFQQRRTNGCWNRYLLPFDETEVITPAFVSALIIWAAEATDAAEMKRDGGYPV